MERQDERVQAAGGPHRARVPDGGGGVRQSGQFNCSIEYSIEFPNEFSSNVEHPVNVKLNRKVNRIFNRAIELTPAVQEQGREEHDVQRGEEGAADSGGRRLDDRVHRAQRHHHHL